MNEQFPYNVNVTLTDGTKTMVSGFVDEEHVRNVTFDIQQDECIGPCECELNPDGECPNGYPAKLRAIGFV